MTDEAITCQVCKTEIAEDFEYPDNGVKWSPARWKRICSVPCQEKAIRLETLFGFKQKLKNPSDLFKSYEDFQKVFAFGEAGGYAEDKYEKFRQSPYNFMLGLDNENTQKFFSSIMN